ncbi:uncharacterized protein LOC112182226 isoform X2 [Rosa chinensis]|uniref:uncharacterized protein LOC112182226 isoform X2 n=1 Tax=Rosa chinensis TaxID=74649 RepID=UPI001AD8B0F5|nr:uncharacterized protein LOC112182226 isoform X2 [Rosa chinensis]
MGSPRFTSYKRGKMDDQPRTRKKKRIKFLQFQFGFRFGSEEHSTESCLEGLVRISEQLRYQIWSLQKKKKKLDVQYLHVNAAIDSSIGLNPAPLLELSATIGSKDLRKVDEIGIQVLISKVESS